MKDRTEKVKSHYKYNLSYYTEFDKHGNTIYLELPMNGSFHEREFDYKNDLIFYYYCYKPNNDVKFMNITYK